MVSFNDARKIAQTFYDNLCEEVFETEELWIFHLAAKGAVLAGGGDPVAVSKADGSARLLLLVLDESWEILNSMKPVASTT